MPTTPTEIIAAIHALIRECDELQRRIVEKENVLAVAYRVVVARKPVEPDGIWAPAEVVLGAGAAQRPGAFLGEVLPPVFELVEAPVVRASKDVLRTYSFEDVAIEQIEDIFNDKVNYTCSSFDDVIRIYEGMKPIVAKFALFGDSDRVIPIMTKFSGNFASVKLALSCALESIQDAPSAKADVLAQLEAANEALRCAASMGATFFRNEGARQVIAHCACGAQVYQGERKCRCGKDVPPASQPNPFGKPFHRQHNNFGASLFSSDVRPGRVED